ncbi:MAG TPA: hypothetical protein VHU41_11330, partial [Thermoanaerobaculia bacterium]|nr:hypothetical protein [Thermoanaerobaculia bacterium]
DLRESSAAAEPGNGPDLWRLLCAAAGDPGFAIESVAPDRLLKQIDLLVDLANWMAMRKSESKVSIDCHALLRLVRDNRPFFTSLFHATGVLAKLWKDEDEIRATHFSVYVAAMIDCYQRMETT